MLPVDFPAEITIVLLINPVVLDDLLLRGREVVGIGDELFDDPFREKFAVLFRNLDVRLRFLFLLRWTEAGR